MRIRTIKPEFWIHEGLCALPDFTRLLAIALLNWADDEGYFMANPAILRGSLFPFLDDSKKIPRSLQELSSVGWIELGNDSAGREIGRVLNFCKHQRVDKPKPSEIKACSAFQDASKNVLGRLSGGMEGNGKGREEEREGSGKPSPDKPGDSSGSAECSISDPASGDDEAESAASKILPPAQKKKGAAAEPEFPEGVGADYQHALGLWWHYKRQRHEGYKAMGWQALIRQQIKFPPERVLASVEASMAANWAGLFTEKCTVAGQPGGAKKETARPAVNVIAEPSGDWREVAARLLLPVMPGEQWALLERVWKVQILKAMNAGDERQPPRQ